MGTRYLYRYRYIFFDLVLARRGSNSFLLLLAPRVTQIHFLSHGICISRGKKAYNSPITHYLASSALKECFHLQKKESPPSQGNNTP